jgi:hypothetical protein
MSAFVLISVFYNFLAKTSFYEYDIEKIKIKSIIKEKVDGAPENVGFIVACGLTGRMRDVL